MWRGVIPLPIHQMRCLVGRSRRAWRCGVSDDACQRSGHGESGGVRTVILALKEPDAVVRVGKHDKQRWVGEPERSVAEIYRAVRQ